eukprot:5199646-Pleurochrysis_carterae.AAC.4
MDAHSLYTHAHEPSLYEIQSCVRACARAALHRHARAHVHIFLATYVRICMIAYLRACVRARVSGTLTSKKPLELHCRSICSPKMTNQPKTNSRTQQERRAMTPSLHEVDLAFRRHEASAF